MHLVLKVLLLESFRTVLFSPTLNVKVAKKVSAFLITFLILFIVKNWALSLDNFQKMTLEFGIIGMISAMELW